MVPALPGEPRRGEAPSPKGGREGLPLARWGCTALLGEQVVPAASPPPHLMARDDGLGKPGSPLRKKSSAGLTPVLGSFSRDLQQGR